MQIHRDQVVDNIIDNSKVDPAAAIVTSKLADALLFILANGTIPFAADQSMGGHKLTNLLAAVSGTDAVNLTQMTAAIAAIVNPFGFPAPARLSSTANVNISNPGTSTFDSVTANNGDRIWLGYQTAPAQIGIYTFNGSGVAMTRVPDMDSWAEIPGAFFAVEEGTLYGNKLYLITADIGGTINTTAVTFMEVPTTPGLLSTNFVVREIPAGAINGSNQTFTLANTPLSGKLEVFRNGVLVQAGAGATEYTLSGAVITTGFTMVAGELLLASYIK